MSKIFINGLNAKAGGGKSILNNYLAILYTKPATHLYYVLVPEVSEYTKYRNRNIKIISIPKMYQNNLMYPYVFTYLIDKILKKVKSDILFNLADIPVRTKVKQVFLFDWSFAAYPESPIWHIMDYKSKIVRLGKLFFFKKYYKNINLFITQTDNMKLRMMSLYDLKEISVVPNAVSIENLSFISRKDFALPEGIKLLYLTHYYPHKNLEILIPLAEEIKKQKEKYKIIITISSDQHKGAKKLLTEISNRDLDTIIINVGPVVMHDVPSLYRQCDGLLMPTILESFSGTYVEAMFHRIPIFTSNIDFATGVCKNGAIYFDPFNVSDILISIKKVFSNPDLKEELISNAEEVLKGLPNWEQTFNMYNECIENCLNS